MKKAFVVGHPIAHSRSPLIHRHWLQEHGIAGSYERIDVAPAEFPAFLAGLREKGFVGGNVTIPHKEEAFRRVGRTTDRAARLEAVNTLWFEGDVLVGDNTDVTGFVAYLDESLGADWADSAGTAVVLGAGGAARAIIAGLADRGLARVAIVNRTHDRAEAVVRAMARLGGPQLEAVAWDRIEGILPETDLLVNTTSLGMEGQAALEVDVSRLPPHAVVSDVVYVPLRTKLLSDAARHGLRIVDGLGMLLHQAVPGFARWFGVTPRVTPELRARIVADLEGTG
jgi:shikimate dehydrogenase